MSPENAAIFVISHLSVTRENIARAKTWIFNQRGANVSGMADQWLREQGVADVREIDTDAEDCQERLASVARSFSLRLAFFQGVWELVAAGVVVPSASPGRWVPPLEYLTSHGRGAIPVSQIGCPHPERIERLPFSYEYTADPDIFLNGVDCKYLHPGILEAIAQSLGCFRRGLYMPATVMLAAAVEGTWIECGTAVGINQSTPNLVTIINNSQAGFGKIVSEVRRVLEHKNAKTLLLKAGTSIHQVNDAEIWTTALRERRNALHWGKAKSFIADHSETGTLLMAAPQHIKTLESIRVVC